MELDEEREQWWADSKETFKPRVQFKNHIHQLAMLNQFVSSVQFIKLDSGHCYECGMTTAHAPDCRFVFEALHLRRSGVALEEMGLNERTTS